MFKIKICGVTRAGDAELAAKFGADAIGINFYRRSLRSVSPKQASDIVRAVQGRALAVGVFVDRTVDEIEQIATECSLDAVQLHGEQPVEFVQALNHRAAGKVICAIPWTQLETVQTKAQSLAENGASTVLLDSQKGRQFGGTGVVLDWSQVRDLQLSIPVALAGGLNPDNVAQAIETARPDGVDVAGGVEQLPGQKDPERVRAFIERARAALGL